MNIFLVDDDFDDREIFLEALRMLSLEITYDEAVNGLDALNKLQSPGCSLPDIIFLDLNMPKMNGREFLVQVKALHQLSHIPVVIYTTSSNKNDINFGALNQAAHFMTKHYSIGHLKAELERVFEMFRSW